jgi:hypothetical protein
MLFPNEVANSAAESVNESSISLEFDETDEPDIPNPINCDAKSQFYEEIIYLTVCLCRCSYQYS